MLTLGLLYDEETTIKLKIKAKTELGLLDHVKILEKQLEHIHKAVSDYIMNYTANPETLPDMSRMKVYANEDLPKKLSTVSEARLRLEKTVKELWNHQEFINLEQYETATEEELRHYVKDLHRLNRLRNYYIDMINELFREKILEKNNV